MQQEEDLVSTPSFLQPDEKEQWEDYTPDLERHNERLNWQKWRPPRGPEQGHHCRTEEQEQQFGRAPTGWQSKARVITDAADCWDHVTLRKEQQAHNDMETDISMTGNESWATF